MSVELKGTIEVTGFQQQNNGEQSGWSLKIKKQDTFAIIALHWTDKEQATHIAFADLQKFKALVASL